MNDDREEHTEGDQPPEAAKPEKPPAEVPVGKDCEHKPRREPEEMCLTPELREWARQQFTEEEIVAALRELREKGGKELGDFLHELEQIVTDSERTER